jgi:hypothetical protein
MLKITRRRPIGTPCGINRVGSHAQTHKYCLDSREVAAPHCRVSTQVRTNPTLHCSSECLHCTGAMLTCFVWSGKCATPCEGDGDRATQLEVRHCYHDMDTYTEFDQEGWTKCDPNYYVAGMYRSCDSLYCLNMLKCCNFKLKDYTSRSIECEELNWGAAFDQRGDLHITANYMRSCMRCDLCMQDQWKPQRRSSLQVFIGVKNTLSATSIKQKLVVGPVVIKSSLHWSYSSKVIKILRHTCVQG